MKRYFSILSIFLIYCQIISCTNSVTENTSSTKDSIMAEEEVTLIPADGEIISYPSVDELKKTDFYPYANAKIINGKNVIYSGGASLAWKELKTFIHKEPLHLMDEPDWLAHLEKDPLTKNDINKEALNMFIGEAGQVVDSLEKLSGKTIPDSIQEHALAVSLTIFKELYFPRGIMSSNDTRGNLDFLFMGQKVEHNLLFGEGTANRSQYKIYDYLSDDHFILKMPLRNDSSEVFFAKVTPKASLQQTYNYVISRVSEKYKSNFQKQNKIIFPSLYFNRHKDYDELRKPIVGTNLHISIFEQYLRFVLNNKGIILADSVFIAVDSVAKAPEGKPKKLYFDSPFLIILKEKDSKVPYFLMWIANEELMRS